MNWNMTDQANEGNLNEMTEKVLKKRQKQKQSKKRVTGESTKRTRSACKGISDSRQVKSSRGLVSKLLMFYDPDCGSLEETR